MRSRTFNLAAGIATGALVAASMMAEEAQAATFEVESGVTSVFLDFENVLEPALGISLVSADGVVDPASGPFQVGFTITPETDLTFSDENGFTPLGGTIEHAGSVTLGIMTGGGETANVTVGNFTIGYDAGRVSDQVTGFFVQDNIDLDTILFDITAPVTTFDFNGQNLALGSDLAVSPEFAAVLLSLGKPDVTGAIAGFAQVNALVAEQQSVPVPEPVSVLGLLATAIAGTAGRRWLNHRAA